MPPALHLLPRASGSRVSGVSDAVNGGLGLAGIVGIGLAIFIVIILVVAILMANAAEHEKERAKQERKGMDPDSDTEDERDGFGSEPLMRSSQEEAREDRRRRKLEERQRDWVIQPLSPLPAVAV